MKVGVFDSGIGGLSVLRELKRLLPNSMTAKSKTNIRFMFRTSFSLPPSYTPNSDKL